ncbi:hypothetical protein D3C73_444330 [compost metagenome]
MHAFGLVDEQEGQVRALHLGVLQHRHFPAAGRAPGGPEIDHQRAALVVRQLHGFTGGIAQADVRQASALFINGQRESRQQPERQAAGHTEAQRTAQARATPAPVQRGEHQRDHPRPGEEPAIAQVDDLPRIAAIVGPVNGDETDPRREHADQEQAEQHRLGVFSPALGHPPTDERRQCQCTDQQQVVKRDGKGAEGKSQH